MAVEEEVGRVLVSGRLTLAVAESCTGGLIGHRVTSVSGSSDYFLGGVIAYSNEVKTRELGVRRDVLVKEGAVSEPVAREMASGVRRKFGADIGLGVTGIAGPGGGTREKPVGLIFVGLAHARGCGSRQFSFSGDRSTIKTAATEAALEMIKEFLQENGAPHG